MANVQREQVASLAGQIEKEMRAIGLDDSTPDSFEAWLLRKYLPSLREDGPLPDPIDVHDKALAAWVKTAPEDDGPKRVLDLLYRLDRTLEIGLEVKRFGFFDSTVSAEKGQLYSSAGRALVNTFEKQSTSYVTWQLELVHPDKRKAPVTLLFDWTYTLDDGTLFGQGTERLTINPDWNESWIAKGWGFASPGHWKIGRHKATIRLWRATLKEDRFVIS
jgi:hypothetical protein